jgi:predicted dehydrogenase
MKKIMLVGGGHRAAFYLRVAKALPEEFLFTSAYVHDPAKAARFEEAWGIKPYTDFDRLLERERADFAVVTIAPDYAAEYIRKLAAANIPVLCETPPAMTLEGLTDLYALVKAGARIQVAEQYARVPLYAAQLAVARSGLIGRVEHAQVSAAHNYHGLSLMRRLLGVTFENALVTAVSLGGKLMDGPCRYNTYSPAAEAYLDTTQTLAVFDFGDRSGVYDFTGAQYDSWVRKKRLMVRGDRGEIENLSVRALIDHETPVELPLTRMDTSEYDYMALRGYALGRDWVYKNRFLPSLTPDAARTFYGRDWDYRSVSFRLTDDEIAVADMMTGMSDYVDTGKDVYPFAEGAQDQYMSLVMGEAIAAGKAVRMTAQPWARPND